MPVKIRLQRHGKKGKPFYWVVAADSRAKRDGKFLEKLGIYNPNTNPATIELNIDGSVKWLQNGAQPTDTARAILSYKGVLLKHHLLGGLRKGALTEEQVEEKFNAWLEEKESKIEAKKSGLDKEKEKARAEALKAEKEVNEKRAQAAAEAELPETPEGEDASEEVEAVTETAPEPKEEVEASTEDVVETPETPQPEAENADTTPVAPVVEKEEIKADDSKEEAPSVQEVVSDEDFEKKDDEKPKPSSDKA